jgi:hypothetical protein
MYFVILIKKKKKKKNNPHYRMAEQLHCNHSSPAHHYPAEKARRNFAVEALVKKSGRKGPTVETESLANTEDNFLLLLFII